MLDRLIYDLQEAINGLRTLVNAGHIHPLTVNGEPLADLLERAVKTLEGFRD